jgi:hypothetical protein
MNSVLWFSESVYCIKIVICVHIGLCVQFLNCFITIIDFIVKQAYYVLMYSQCLNLLFRATVDVLGVVKKGEVDTVSNICQNTVWVWRIHCGCIIYPLKRQMVVIFQENFRVIALWPHITIITLPLLSS